MKATTASDHASSSTTSRPFFGSQHQRLQEKTTAKDVSRASAKPFFRAASLAARPSETVKTRNDEQESEKGDIEQQGESQAFFKRNSAADDADPHPTLQRHQAFESESMHAQMKASNQRFFRRLQPKLTMGRPGDTYEREADRVADAVVGGNPAPQISALPSGGLRQQADSRSHSLSVPSGVERDCRSRNTVRRPPRDRRAARPPRLRSRRSTGRESS